MGWRITLEWSSRERHEKEELERVTERDGDIERRDKRIFVLGKKTALMGSKPEESDHTMQQWTEEAQKITSNVSW